MDVLKTIVATLTLTPWELERLKSLVEAEVDRLASPNVDELDEPLRSLKQLRQKLMTEMVALNLPVEGWPQRVDPNY